MITTRQNFDLAQVTTFAIPAKCSRYIEYDQPEDIPLIISELQDVDRLYHIGGGSNLLFTHDYDGVVAHSAIKGIDVVDETTDGVTVRVGAGVVMDDFISWACDRGLWGVENLSGIPGEAGASAVQNVGAYGAEAADTIVEVHAYDSHKNEFVTFTNEDCHYGYRDSIFKRSDIRGRYIIHSVVYRLSSVPKPNICYPALKDQFDTPPDDPHLIRRAVIAIRDSKLPDPSKVPSAGSFFKNPVINDDQLAKIISIEGTDTFPHYRTDNGWKIPAAWLIDRCGWKGHHDNNAAVWHLQPLVITNPGRKASAADILDLEDRIKQSVRERYGVNLEPEVEHI
ncbi:MAG: UDP-N-acetylmuramate dehydrogenase [Bacteroides sp.]|nr:UDP-N-acetylmuramate dehydrogenase [Bacteroides sp.]